MIPDTALPDQDPVLNRGGGAQDASPEIPDGDELATRNQARDIGPQPGRDARFLEEVLETPVMALATKPATQALAGETHLQTFWP